MNAQMEMKNMLTEEELVNIVGGRSKAKARPRSRARATSTATSQKMVVQCKNCEERFGADMSSSLVACPYCGFANSFAG